MAKREFLQLAHKYDSTKHGVYNWMISEKLDGIRCFWDGGVSRNIPASEIPWANVAKDHRLRDQSIATGLWSRYGKVIHAPDWWLNHLPACPLDGELWMGRGQWQKLTTVVKKFDKGIGWEEVKMMILDSPPLQTVLEDGVINNTNFKKTFNSNIEWLKRNGGAKYFRLPTPFIFTYEKLIQANIDNKYCQVLTQITIPMTLSYKFVEGFLNDVIEAGGEGVILKNPSSRYACERSYDVLKYKPFNDDEGIVIGYNWGKETELGSKLLGLMGSMIVSYKGIEFELSGFTDEERVMTWEGGKDAGAYGCDHPGERVESVISNPKFPIGSKVTFRYRELSDKGTPKEARYLRKFES